MNLISYVQIDVMKMPVTMYNGVFHDGIVCIRGVCTGLVITKPIWSDCMAVICKVVMDVFCLLGPPGIFICDLRNLYLRHKRQVIESGT